MKKINFSNISLKSIINNSRGQQIIGVAIPLVFLGVLSWYNYLMVESYNYTIFDLGLSYRLLYLFAYHHIIIFNGTNILFSPSPFGKFIFIPLSVLLYLYDSVVTPLLIQIIVIASGGYAVFRIAQMKTGSLLISLIIEAAYFLYPATYGFMTHGGNYQVLIEGFILIGYMFYIQGKWVYAFLAFAMASLTNIWAPLIVFGFIFVDYITQNKLYYFHNVKAYYNKIKSLHLKKGAELFYLSLIAFDVIIFAQSLHYAGGFYSLLSASRISLPSTGQSSTLHSYFYQNFLSNLGSYKLPFLSNVLSPVLFIPVFTPYILPILFYFLIIFSETNNISYYIILQQYPYLFASFVFIGTIHFFKEMTAHPVNIGNAKKLAAIMLIASIVSFSLYSPFSVSSFENSSVQNQIDVTTFDTDLTFGLSLIPLNSSVFIQNDLPQLMNREEVYMPGFYHNESVDYAVIIPFGFSPISKAYGGYSSYWAQHFQNNLSYGVYEDIMGAIVYKLNYSHQPVFYVPFNQVILPGEDGLNGYGQIINNTLIISNFNDVYHNTLWGGGYTSLSPGEYSFTFQVMVTNTSSRNVYVQYIWADLGQINLHTAVINGSDFRNPGQWKNFTTILAIDQFYTGVECPAIFSKWNGTIEFRGVTIEQVGPAMSGLHYFT